MSDKVKKLFEAVTDIDDELIESALPADKSEKLYNAVTNIDDALIESALSATPNSVKAAPVTAFTNRPWVKWAAAAAVFVIVAAAPLAMYKLGVFSNDNLAPPSSSAESDVPEVTPSSEHDSGSSGQESGSGSEQGNADVVSNSEGSVRTGDSSSERIGSDVPANDEQTPQGGGNSSSESAGGTDVTPPDDPDNQGTTVGGDSVNEPEEGVFVKENMSPLTYRIMGEIKTFNYMNSSAIKGSSATEENESYVVDHYVGSDLSTISILSSTGELRSYGVDLYHTGAPDFDVTDDFDVTEHYLIRFAKAAALNTDIALSGLENASASVLCYHGKYYVTLAVPEGSVIFCFTDRVVFEYLVVDKGV
ncbi:MAG: hypothetical protein IJU94_00990 [Clostridia bacterium]|nr:hypothetical protein [Clostridia bacterium]